jgi:hypothetical protein
MATNQRTITKRRGTSSISKLLVERLLRVSPLTSNWDSQLTKVNFIQQLLEGIISHLHKTTELIQFSQMIKCKQKVKIHDPLICEVTVVLYSGYHL